MSHALREERFCTTDEAEGCSMTWDSPGAGEPQLRVAVFGKGGIGPEDARYQLAQGVGRELWYQTNGNVQIINGGEDGVMEAVSRSAMEVSGGRAVVIGYMFDGRTRKNRYLSKEVDCSAMHPNTPVPRASYWSRRGMLVQTAHAFVVIAGGGSGTACELLDVARCAQKGWGPGFKNQRPIVVVSHPLHLSFLGYTQQGIDLLAEWGFIGSEARQAIKVCSDPVEAVQDLLARIPRPLEQLLVT